MKIFISSLISGYEHYRTAVQEAVETLGHQVIRPENLPASAGTPQQACLGGVRESDGVVLLIGERYGSLQPSGLSATHEEYREARERKPVLVFVESGVTREPSQQDFLDEIGAWTTGRLRVSFSNPAELQRVVLRALHNHELATSGEPVEEQEMLDRATRLFSLRQDSSGSAQLFVAIASSPHQQVLRPAEMEEAALARELQREALFGDHPVLNPAEGTTTEIRDNALVLKQRFASVLVDQVGSVRVIQPARRETRRSHPQLSALIEEDVTEALAHALHFAGWLLERVDPMRRLTDVVVVSSILGAGYMPWRTRAEHVANPGSGQMGRGGAETTVMLTPPRRHRQALTHDADRMAEDLMVLIRRRLRQ